MEYRRVGSSDLVVSAIGLGCNNLGRPKTVTYTQAGTDDVIKTAVEQGITFFDVADVYGQKLGMSEIMLGKALGSQREHVVIGTKFGLNVHRAYQENKDGLPGSQGYIRKSLEASLKRLNTDYIDVYQFHTPDLKTPIDETLETLAACIQEGKIRYIGHCNFAGWHISQAHYCAALKKLPQFISAQNHYNLLDRRAELEVLPAAKALHLGVFPYFPLANGLLTDKYKDVAERTNVHNRLVHSKPKILEDAPWERLEKYYAFCEARNVRVTDVTFSWLLTNTSISSVIAGATTAEQVKANAHAFSWCPDEKDLQDINDIFPPEAPIALF